MANQISNPSLVERIKEMLRQLFIVNDRHQKDVPSAANAPRQEENGVESEDFQFDFASTDAAVLSALEKLSVRHPKIQKLASFHSLAYDLDALMNQSQAHAVLEMQALMGGGMYYVPGAGSAEDRREAARECLSNLQSTKQRFDAEFRSLYGSSSAYDACCTLMDQAIASACRTLEIRAP